MSTIKRTFVLTLALIAPAFFVSAQSTRDVRVKNTVSVNCLSGCSSAAGVAAADGMANPTAPQELSYLFVWNGASYDRLRGDTTSGMWVNIKNASIAVTGTFWQATQPVSIAATVTTDPSDRAARLLGKVYGSQGQPLTQTATNFNLQSELATGGTLYDARQIRALTTADNVTVTPPAITKGTQGTTGFTTQDLKDAGRTGIHFTADAVAVATTEGLVTFTKDVGGTSTASQTTYSVTSGKRFRVNALTISLTDTSTTVARTRVRLRENTGGTCIATSSIVWTGDFGPLPGTQAAGMALQGPLVIPFPDGIEFPAADSICISEIATTNTTAVLSVTLNGYEY